MPKWSDLQMASGALTLVSVMMLMAYKQTKSFENETRLAFRERSRNHHQNVIENLTDSSKRREAKIEAARNKNKQIEELLKLEEMLHNLNGFPYESLLSFHKNGEGRFSIQNLSTNILFTKCSKSPTFMKYLSKHIKGPREDGRCKALRALHQLVNTSGNEVILHKSIIESLIDGLFGSLESLPPTVNSNSPQNDITRNLISKSNSDQAAHTSENLRSSDSATSNSTNTKKTFDFILRRSVLDFRTIRENIRRGCFLLCRTFECDKWFIDYALNYGLFTFLCEYAESTIGFSTDSSSFQDNKSYKYDRFILKTLALCYERAKHFIDSLSKKDKSEENHLKKIMPVEFYAEDLTTVQRNNAISKAKAFLSMGEVNVSRKDFTHFSHQEIKIIKAMEKVRTMYEKGTNENVDDHLGQFFRKYNFNNGDGDNDSDADEQDLIERNEQFMVLDRFHEVMKGCGGVPDSEDDNENIFDDYSNPSTPGITSTRSRASTYLSSESDNESVATQEDVNIVLSAVHAFSGSLDSSAI